MIKAILVLVFGVAPPSSAKRKVMLNLLDDNAASQPTKIADAIKNPLEAPESVAAAGCRFWNCKSIVAQCTVALQSLQGLRCGEWLDDDWSTACSDCTEGRDLDTRTGLR